MNGISIYSWNKENQNYKNETLEPYKTGKVRVKMHNKN